MDKQSAGLTEEERKAKQRDYNRRYREANREKVAEQQRRWYEANREKVKAERRARYADNPEKTTLTAAQRKRRSENEKARRARFTPEQHEEYNRKAAAAQRKRYANMTAEQRRRRVEQSIDYARRKAAERRAKREAEAAAREAERNARRPAVKAANREALLINSNEVYDRIMEALPPLAYDDRADITNDIVIALLDGDITIDEIKSAAGPFVTAHFKARGYHDMLSLDATIPGTSATYMERLET